MNIRYKPPKKARHIEYQTVTASTKTFVIENALGYQNFAVRLMADNEVSTSTVDLKIQGYMETMDAWYDIPGASLAQITSDLTAPTDLLLSPNAAAVSNRVVSRPVPHLLRVVLVVGGTSFDIALESELF